MTKKTAIILSISCLLAISCKEKQEQKDIIVPAPVVKQEKKTMEMSETHQEYTESLNGKKYSIDIIRSADHSLPLTSDDMGNAYYDNIITVRVHREDGSDLLNKTFRKSDFAEYLGNNELRKTGALLGIVYDKIDNGKLSFAASVGSPDPNSDEYIPLTLTLSTSGALYIAIDNKADIVDIEEEEDEGV